MVERLLYFGPVFLTVVLIFFSVLPLPLPFYGLFAPSFALMSVYFWTVHRPELMPQSAVFVMGLLQDVLMGTPLGVNAVVLLVAHMAVLSRRRGLVGHPFWFLWWGFALLAPAAMALTWILMSILNSGGLSIDVAIFAAIMAILAFPPLAWILIAIQRIILEED